MHKWLRTSKKGNVRLQKGTAWEAPGRQERTSWTAARRQGGRKGPNGQPGARAANGLTGTHTQWMEARTGTHTHTPSPGRTTWHTHPVLEEQPGLAHTHTPSPGRIARTGAHTQDWHTHTHTPSPWTEARTGTHTHTQSWKNSQDWHTHPGLAFAVGVYKWLRTSEKGNARLQKGAGAANGLQICCGHAKWLRASLPKQAEGKGSRKNTYSALLKLRVESVKGRQNLKGYGMLREAAAKSSGKGCGFE